MARLKTVPSDDLRPRYSRQGGLTNPLNRECGAEVAK